MSRISTLLDIEPLGREREQAIKAGVFAALDRERVAAAARDRRAHRPRWLWVLGLAGLGAAAAVLVLVLRPAGDPARPDRTAAVGTRVATDQSPSVFSAGDATLTALPHSTVVVAGDDAEHGTHIALERGAVVCDVAPRAGRRPFRVRAGELEVVVVGTAFTVTREGDAGHVAVTRGVVEARWRGQMRRLGAGESWTPAESAAAEAPPTETAAAETEAETPPAGERAPARTLERDPRPDRPRTRPAAKPVTLPAKERYETAARLERTDSARSIALYAELVAEGGPWAATALFAQGRLEYERGRTAAARKLLERYLRSHATGPNAEVARKLLDDMEK